MRKYETVLVLNPDLSEADLKEELKKIENLVQANGGQSIHTDRWGKKELGFRMRKRTVGQYVCLTFESENSELMNSLTSVLRIHDHVLKFQSHRISDRVRKFKGNTRRSSAGGDESADGEFAAV